MNEPSFSILAYVNWNGDFNANLLYEAGNAPLSRVTKTRPLRTIVDC